MIKVMHVLGSFGPGGAEMGVLRLIQSFQDKELMHSVCSIGPDVSMESLLPAGIKCYSLGLTGRSYTAFIPLYRLLRSTRTDIAHVNNLAPWLDASVASRLAGSKCIETFHGVEEKSARFSAKRRGLLKMACILTSKITAVAESSRNLLVELTGIKKRRISVLPNGVDTDLFAPALSDDDKKKIRGSLHLPENGFLIGCVSALRPVKDHEGLIRAFALFLSSHQNAVTRGNANLVLVGGGPLASELKLLSKQLGIGDQIIFMGRRNDVQEILRVLDIFVLNSKTEGMSYAVLEAMSTGLPVIATAVGANTELISHGSDGYLVSHGDVGSLTGYMIKLASDGSLLSKMGKNAREKIIRTYSLSKMVSSYQDLYREFYCDN